MIREESNKKLDKVIKSLAKGFDPAKLTKSLMDLREDALVDEDPLLAKTFRLASEYMTENDCFDYTVEKVEIELPEDAPEDAEDEAIKEPGTNEENLTYLLELIKRSDNKFNREEIKEMRTFLKRKLY